MFEPGRDRTGAGPTFGNPAPELFRELSWSGALLLIFIVIIAAVLRLWRCLNWAVILSVLQAWQPSHGAWLVVASVNGACLVALFLGYLILTLNYSGTAGSFATADSKGER